MKDGDGHNVTFEPFNRASCPGPGNLSEISPAPATRVQDDWALSI